MKRNLRFWTRYTWESLEAELIAVGMFLLMGLFNSEPAWTQGAGGWMDLLALLPFYLIIAAVLCIIILSPGSQMLYIPLLISCGEPRRNVFWGFQYHRFLLIAVTSAVSGLIWVLVPGEISAACLYGLPVIVTGLVIISSFGNLLGSAYVKWKWAGTIVLVLFFGACGGLAGWLMNRGGFDLTTASMTVLGMVALFPPWQMMLAAVVLLAVDMGAQWLLLRRREVKL